MAIPAIPPGPPRNPLAAVFIDAFREALSGTPGIPLGNQPYKGYVTMIPGAQAVTSGSAKTIAGSPTAEVYPSALTGRGTLTDAQMWANPGYISTLAAIGGQAEMPLGAYAPNLASGQGQLLAFIVNAAPPTATAGLITQSDGVTGLQGFSLRGLPTGKLNLTHQSSAGSVAPVAATVGTFLDSTDRAGMLFIHPSGYLAIWFEGELDTVVAVNPANFPLGLTNPTAPLTLGAIASVAGNPILTACMAAKFRGVHLISFNEFPLNLNQIAKKLKSDPMTPLRNSDVVHASKLVALYWMGAQSNESGSGNTAGVVGPYGVPDRDAYAAGRSIISGLAKRLATRGVAALWGKSAVGSTALTDSWCGRIRNWSNPSNVLSGTYMLSGGVVWKCTNAIGFGAASTVAPAAGTGADTVTWASLGAPTAEDLSVLADTGVYPPTSARFDPMGLFAAGEARAAAMVSTTSERMGIVCIGQGDRTVGASRAAYSAGIQYAAAYVLAAGRSATKFSIAMTVRSAFNAAANWSTYNGGGAANADNDTADHWYDRQLLPGRLDAIAALAGNPKVFVGWDWATGIGPVTSQSYPTGIGVKALTNVGGTDLLHMTDATYESRAVPLVDATLLACGV